jgi:hypothetical protein
VTAEPTREPSGDQPSAPTPQPTPPPSSDIRPTYQTAASEAVEVAAQEVAQHVAAAVAAKAAAAMAAAEAAAAEEAALAETAAAEAATAEASASMEAAAVESSAADASPADVPAIDAGASPGPESPMGASAPSGWMTPAAPADASMAATAPATTVDAPAIPPATATVADPAAPAVATPDASPKPSRRPVIVAWTRRFTLFVVSIALLAGGVMLGSTTFQRTRPVPTNGGAIEFTQPPADVAKEFITALAAGDSDAIRSSLSMQPNKDLTDEFTKFGIKKVTGVETLGTAVDGPRSATEVLLHTTDTDGNTFDINLIILVNGNQIEGFR